MTDRLIETTNSGGMGRGQTGGHQDSALRGRDIILSLVALFTLGIAQPLLDLLGRNAPFLVAHDAGRLDVIALAVGLPIVMPLIIGAAVLLVRAWSPRLGAAVHSAIIIVLVAILVLAMVTLAEMGGRLAGWLLLGLAAALGVAAAFVYRRSAAIRRAVSLAAVGAPAVAGLFLFASPVSSLVFADPQAEVGVATDGGKLPPIIIVMFDEFPLASLLDEDMHVDRQWYPSFARLAEDAYLFSNYTTAYEASVHAVPTALSGRFSDAQALANTSGHPTNLFSLLADRYKIRAVEPITDLCPNAGCDSQESESSTSTTSNAALVRDLGIVAAHLFVPEDMAGGLPPVDASWRDFARFEGAGAETPVLGAGGASAGAPKEPLTVSTKPRNANHQQQFRQFIADIGPSRRPTLDFIHLIFPHRPWRYLPDGRRHTGAWEPAQHSEKFWIDREWPVSQGYQLHLAQVQLADVLIGDLMKKLQRAGMYEDALIVITADHGISFEAGLPFRKATPDTWGGIGPVPLFIKAPGQSLGRVDTTPMQSIDLLPTILDLMGADARVDLDGASRLDKMVPPLRQRVIYASDGAHQRYPADAMPYLREAVEHKVHIFGSGGRGSDLFHLAPPGTDDLLGRALTGSEPTAEGLTVELQSARAYANVDHASDVVPAHLMGRILGSPAFDRPSLAVAVNGRIAAVTKADLGNDSIGRFRALMPPSSLQQGKNDVRILLVEDGTSLRVIPLAD